jgi:hypothetical protein
MSTNSIKNDFVVPALSGDSREAGDYTTGDGSRAHRERSLLGMLSFGRWGKQVLETFVFLAVIVVAQGRLFGAAEIPGLPHPYWLPVLLASCQYGVSGGMIATVAASAVYFFGLSPPSATEDFYSYAGMVAVQPAAWLATALVLGGLRNLHIHQSAELTDQLAASRRRANDLSNGLERATAEINALERRIAFDMSSAAALSRGFSLINMSDRRAAAMSFGEVFRVGTGTATFTAYVKESEAYVPVWAVEEDTPRSTKSIEPIPLATIESMMTESAGRGTTCDAEGSNSRVERCVIRVPPSDIGSEPLAAIVCERQTSQDARQFHRRAEELGRALATILCACPNPPPGARS